MSGKFYFLEVFFTKRPPPVPDSGVLLHRVLRPRLLRQPALVPDGGGDQLPRHHLLQHLLPLPSRAAQQTPDQLAHGGQYLLTYLKIFLSQKIFIQFRSSGSLLPPPSSTSPRLFRSCQRLLTTKMRSTSTGLTLRSPPGSVWCHDSFLTEQFN